NLNQFTLNLAHEDVRAALVMSLLSVWVLVGLFAYLNRYTRQSYFSIWTLAWLLYAGWLTLCLGLQNWAPHPLLIMLKQWCVGASATFLLWGAARFLKQRTSRRTVGLFLGFLLLWSWATAFYLDNWLVAELPV